MDNMFAITTASIKVASQAAIEVIDYTGYSRKQLIDRIDCFNKLNHTECSIVSPLVKVDITGERGNDFYNNGFTVTDCTGTDVEMRLRFYSTYIPANMFDKITDGSTIRLKFLAYTKDDIDFKEGKIVYIDCTAQSDTRGEDVLTFPECVNDAIKRCHMLHGGIDCDATIAEAKRLRTTDRIDVNVSVVPTSAISAKTSTKAIPHIREFNTINGTNFNPHTEKICSIMFDGHEHAGSSNMTAYGFIATLNGTELQLMFDWNSDSIPASVFSGKKEGDVVDIILKAHKVSDYASQKTYFNGYYVPLRCKLDQAGSMYAEYGDFEDLLEDMLKWCDEG